jgi:putative addiction module component (TIGR02574 family)
MEKRQLTEQLMALPLAERVDLAEALWQSIGEGLRSGEEQEAIAEARRRDAELDSGSPGRVLRDRESTD